MDALIRQNRICKVNWLQKKKYINKLRKSSTKFYQMAFHLQMYNYLLLSYLFVIGFEYDVKSITFDHIILCYSQCLQIFVIIRWNQFK